MHLWCHFSQPPCCLEVMIFWCLCWQWWVLMLGGWYYWNHILVFFADCADADAWWWWRGWRWEEDVDWGGGHRSRFELPEFWSFWSDPSSPRWGVWSSEFKVVSLNSDHFDPSSPRWAVWSWTSVEIIISPQKAEASHKSPAWSFRKVFITNRAKHTFYLELSHGTSYKIGLLLHKNGLEGQTLPSAYRPWIRGLPGYRWIRWKTVKDICCCTRMVWNWKVSLQVTYYIPPTRDLLAWSRYFTEEKNFNAAEISSLGSGA